MSLIHNTAYRYCKLVKETFDELGYKYLTEEREFTFEELENIRVVLHQKFDFILLPRKRKRIIEEGIKTTNDQVIANRDDGGFEVFNNFAKGISRNLFYSDPLIKNPMMSAERTGYGERKVSLRMVQAKNVFDLFRDREYYLDTRIHILLL